MKYNKKLYICLTYYHILVTLVKEIDSADEVDIVICNTIPEYDRISESLKDSGIFNNIFFFDEKYYQLNNPLDGIKFGKLDVFFSNRKIRKAIPLPSKLLLHSYDDINIFNDAANIGYSLRANKIYYNLLEDAKNSYKVLDQYMEINYEKSLKKKILGFAHETLYYHGKSKFSKIVEVNDDHGLKIPQEKIIVKNKRLMFDTLSTEQKERIFEIFMHGSEQQITYDSGATLILTQPLFEDGIVKTADVQKEIYSNIIEMYCRGERIFIKPHPRDNFDYTKHFQFATMLNKNLPTEVLEFKPKVTFRKAITVTSSSIQGIEFIEDKVYLGFDWLSKYQ